MSEEKVALLREFRRRNVAARERIDGMRSGRFGLFETLPDGSRRDLTSEAIERDEAAIAENERLLALYDPDGITANEDE